MTLPPVRVRFAPSPTGLLHVGGARTALYCYLLARQTGGSFILRIEDTDQKRYNPQSYANIVDSLRFLGLDWDEGPDVGGDYGPYIQTHRLELYHTYARRLLDAGAAYRCFCTPERLAEVNDARRRAGQSPGYDRACRALAPAEAERRAQAGEPHVIRVKIPLEGRITVRDYLRGDITVDNSTLQDAVMVKSDGIPTYNFAVIVDDYLMKITHVMRGAEYISSLPLYGHIYRALGWQPPLFVHLPLILNPSGKGKMSKRETRAPDGKTYPVFVHTFQELGYLPEALVNYLALVGWSYDDKTELMTRDELIDRFSLDRVNVSAAAWNYAKLDHFNGIYIRRLSAADLTDRLLPFLKAAGINADRETMLKITPLIQERLAVLSDVPAWVDFFFVDELPPYDPALLVPKKISPADVPPILQKARAALSTVEFDHAHLESALREAAAALGVKAGQMFQPVRVAVCGKKVSPPLFGTLEVVGRETTLHRIDRALALLNAPTPPPA
ncbi:MAG: glutamate--tRNA ligase [Anaerolineae bacterium]